MIDDELYIPPCCIDRKLPPVIRQGGAFSVFYSQGDWTMQQLWHAVSQLVPSATFTAIVVDDLDTRALRYLRATLVRYPAMGLAMATANDCTSFVQSEMADVLSRVWYVGGRSEALHSHLWLRSAPAATLLVSGPLFTSHSALPHYFCKYTASLQPDAAGITLAQQTFRPWRSIFRLHASLRGDAPLFTPWLVDSY